MGLHGNQAGPRLSSLGPQAKQEDKRFSVRAAERPSAGQRPSAKGHLRKAQTLKGHHHHGNDDGTREARSTTLALLETKLSVKRTN